MRCLPTCRAATMKKEICSGEFWRDVFSEFLATFMLVSIQCVLPLTWGRQGEFDQAILTGLGMGFIVATMAWSLGDFGGGHMNPAVTFGMMLAAKITFLRGVFYIIVQCLGGLAGAGFAFAITPLAHQDGLSATTLGPDVEPWQGYLTETWITCILVLTIFGATNSKRKGGNLGMPTVVIGLALSLGIMAGFKHTGGSLNPARSLGPAVVKGIWKDHWVYWAGPLTGGALAAFFYAAILDRVDRRKSEKTEITPPNGQTNTGFMNDDFTHIEDAKM